MPSVKLEFTIDELKALREALGVAMSESCGDDEDEMMAWSNLSYRIRRILEEETS